MKSTPDIPSLLPRREEMLTALRARDRSYDGLFYVGVTTTGVFCRPSCPARDPKPEHVEFYGFDLPLEYPGSPFQRRVWDALLRIPYGETRTYAQLAREVGAEGAARAVGAANGADRIAIVIPCHRVIAADGGLGGYGGGLWRKLRLLKTEGVLPPSHGQPAAG